MGSAAGDHTQGDDGTLNRLVEYPKSRKSVKLPALRNWGGFSIQERYLQALHPFADHGIVAACGLPGRNAHSNPGLADGG